MRRRGYKQQAKGGGVGAILLLIVPLLLGGVLQYAYPKDLVIGKDRIKVQEISGIYRPDSVSLDGGEIVVTYTFNAIQSDVVLLLEPGTQVGGKQTTSEIRLELTSDYALYYVPLRAYGFGNIQARTGMDGTMSPLQYAVPDSQWIGEYYFSIAAKKDGRVIGELPKQGWNYLQPAGREMEIGGSRIKISSLGTSGTGWHIPTDQTDYAVVYITKTEYTGADPFSGTRTTTNTYLLNKYKLAEAVKDFNDFIASLPSDISQVPASNRLPVGDEWELLGSRWMWKPSSWDWKDIYEGMTFTAETNYRLDDEFDIVVRNFDVAQYYWSGLKNQQGIGLPYGSVYNNMYVSGVLGQAGHRLNYRVMEQDAYLTIKLRIPVDLAGLGTVSGVGEAHRYPDLRILSKSLDKSTYKSGDPVTLTVSVKNYGDACSDPKCATVSVASNGIIFTPASQSFAIGKDETKTLVFKGTAQLTLAKGTGVVEVIASSAYNTYRETLFFNLEPNTDTPPTTTPSPIQEKKEPTPLKSKRDAVVLPLWLLLGGFISLVMGAVLFAQRAGG